MDPAAEEQSSGDGASGARDRETNGPNGNGADDGQHRIPADLAVMPVRGTVVFPGTIMPLTVGRPASRRLLDEVLPQSKIIALFTQKDHEQEEPGIDDLYSVGTAALVLKMFRQPDETVQIIVHGLRRVSIGKVNQRSPFVIAQVDQLPETSAGGKTFHAALNQLKEQATRLIELTPDVPEQALTVMMNIEGPSNLADFLMANLSLDVDQKQDMLEELDIAKRVRAVHRHVSTQLEIQQLQHKIQQDVETSIGDSQRKFFLREQAKAIQKELGEDGDGEDHFIERLEQRLRESDPPEKVMEEATRELNRLKAIPPASPEYSIIASYVELLAELPWNKASKDKLDLVWARRILDRDHFDLDKVKRRLVEYLAVRKLNPSGRGPILCLVGPPGVGKTSLGQSIADAMGRKFVRMSLGGIRDEAEIRGHRRTYIGAMPGRIIQELRRAGTNNPVMMLDEVDKLGADFRGDPSAALLEVLDPRQNNSFVDRYLDVPFDLSQVIFIATANYMGNVPPALHDRMEVIEIAGYTDNDKLAIARKYLVPRQLKENGLTRKQCQWVVSGIRMVIENYTREAGVRELERQIGSVCRALAAIVAGRRNGRVRKTVVIDAQQVRKLIGPEKFVRDLDTRLTSPGVAVGLAYTPAGGELLFIEVTHYPGKGHMLLTGQIGDVMKESATAAMSLFKSRAPQLGVDVAGMSKQDMHIHVPAGAVPKDGPSAGIAMYCAIASLMLDLTVEPGLAMTGELTLRGRVLPIGGVKEKTLAAARAGIKTVILPKQNQRDLEEIDAQVRKKLKFHFVDSVDQVLNLALGGGRKLKIKNTKLGIKN
jgi:ATP-dependent Lon protease